MFEMNRYDQEMFDYFLNERMAHVNGEYDFTFEGRNLIYHVTKKEDVTYYLIDKVTRLTSRLATVDREYNEDEYNELIPEIVTAIRLSGSRHTCRANDSAPNEVIDAIFRIILPQYGFAVREEQIELCKKMCDGMLGKHVTIAEAGVGMGKSFAYEIAAIVAAHKQPQSAYYPVTIATSSIELQKTIAEVDIPELSQILMDYQIIDRPLSCAVRKGKEHYFCPRRYLDYVEKIQKNPQKYEQLLKLFQEKDMEVRALDLDKYQIPEAVKKKICVKSCFHCSHSRICQYKNHLTRARDGRKPLDFQVTNHHLLLANTKETSALRESRIVIIDEAHKFKDAAESIYGVSLTEKDVRQYIQNVRNDRDDGANAVTWLMNISSALKINQQLFDFLTIISENSDDDRRASIEVDTRLRSFLTNLKKQIEKIEDSKCHGRSIYEKTGIQILRELDVFLSGAKYHVWTETDENGLRKLCCAPTDVAGILKRYVWDRNVSYVLTSGTMSDGADFSFFKRENGLGQISPSAMQECSYISPFDYAKNARLYLASDVPYPDNDSEVYTQRVSKRIIELVHATHGHTAILFTSYKVLQAVYNLSYQHLTNYEIIRMTRSDRTAIQRFKNSKNAVLFASGSMWEGVDCVGDTLSSVIIVRLPFPLQSEESERKIRECGSVKEYVHNFAVPEMLIRLRQGAGRLIRSETDTGVIAILDPRAVCSSYSDRVKLALSNYQSVRSVEEVQQFIKQVKPQEYFE